MKKAEIDAVKMVRAIRDRHAAVLKGKTSGEIIAFYNSRAKAALPEQTKSTKRPRRSA